MIPVGKKEKTNWEAFYRTEDVQSEKSQEESKRTRHHTEVQFFLVIWTKQNVVVLSFKK